MKLKLLRSALENYEVLESIGEGCTGSVLKIRDTDGSMYAAKVLKPELAGGERRRRFKNELSFCLRNQHHNIVKVIDHGVVDGKPGSETPFYVMPLYDSTLRRVMEQHITPADVLPLFSKIMDGVDAAHLQHVAHRDIKPENILYDSATKQPVIADFGIAHFCEDHLHTLVETQPGTRLANFQYAAPEQKMRDRVVDHRADIYALGLILNEMFTGEIPQGTGYVLIGSRYPAYAFLDAVVERMIHQDPKQRYDSIDKLKKDLIGREQLFVSRQRLDKHRATVIPDSDVSDPLVASPPSIVSVDWNADVLIFRLSVTPSPEWVGVFHGIPAGYSLGYGGPQTVEFRGTEARVSARTQDVMSQRNFFKQWLATAVRDYEKHIKTQNTERIQREREALARKVAQEDERQRVLSKLRDGEEEKTK